MGNFGKWLWGIIILTIVALLVGWFAPAPWGAKANSVNMGKSVQASLQDGGFGWAKSEMSGNIARLTGVAPSAEAKAGAIAAAQNAQCEKCADRENGKRWHVVDGEDVTVRKVVATQVPYTFSGVLSQDGGLVLNGYVRNEDERVRVLAEAERLYPGKVTDSTLKVANGAPNMNWYAIGAAHLSGLSQLKNGQFMITDTDSFLSGEAGSIDARAAINAMLAGLPAGFNGSSKIDVANAAPVVIGQLKDETVCQNLFAELKGDNKINFAYGGSAIEGAPSIALLDAMAEAVKQCSSFRVTVEGHTDADGADDYNQNLSQQRAEAVVTYLVDNNVNPANVTAVGYGETKPIASNDTRQGMAANRRIEFTVTRSK
ncbi:MAG: OmpA family protein [Robiginitomaculum sp.]|nr:OmpA family protein [Robiginitomaculum sp.]